MLRLKPSSTGLRLPPLLAALAALAALPACDGCHAGKPYTPYTLTDSPSASATAAAGDAGPAAPGPLFSALPGVPAPGDGTVWPLAGGAALPPAGQTFVTGLVLDADGDGKDDLLAWSRAPDGLRGGIWFAPGSNPAAGRAVATLPTDVAVPGCGAGASISQIGPRAVALDYEPRCPPRLRDRAVRWIAVLRLPAAAGAIPELGLELRLGLPAEGESLQVALDGRDRDGDGRGDLAATLTLTGAPRPLPAGGSAAVTLAFLDRPAGLSRDPTEPEASFKALTAGLVADGRKKTTAPRIPAAALAARRLQALLCEEAGHPAITTSAGPVRCGDTRVAEDSTMAEIEAALNLGDPVLAIAALGRLDALGPRRKDVDALVAKSVPTVQGRRIRTTLAVPDLKPPPSFGPLAFDGGGDLLVRTSERVVRVDHASFDETPVDDAGAAGKWPGRLVFPAGAASPTWTLGGVAERCDAPALVARFDVGGEATEVALPVAPSARCAAGQVPVDLLGASAQGALIAVRGEVVALPMETPPHPAVAESLALAPGAAVDPGAARSPDGGVIAVPSSRGVLVAVLKGAARGATAKLWTAPAEDRATACVPASGGGRLACATPRGAAIYDER